MIAGRFAFHGLSEFLTLQKVKQMDYSFPEGFDPAGKDLVEKLLVGPICPAIHVMALFTFFSRCAIRTKG